MNARKPIVTDFERAFRFVNEAGGSVKLPGIEHAIGGGSTTFEIRAEEPLTLMQVMQVERPQTPEEGVADTKEKYIDKVTLSGDDFAAELIVESDAENPSTSTTPLIPAGAKWLAHDLTQKVLSVESNGGK